MAARLDHTCFITISISSVRSQQAVAISPFSATSAIQPSTVPSCHWTNAACHACLGSGAPHTVVAGGPKILAACEANMAGRNADVLDQQHLEALQRMASAKSSGSLDKQLLQNLGDVGSWMETSCSRVMPITQNTWQLLLQLIFSAATNALRLMSQGRQGDAAGSPAVSACVIAVLNMLKCCQFCYGFTSLVNPKLEADDLASAHKLIVKTGEHYKHVQSMQSLTCPSRGQKQRIV